MKVVIDCNIFVSSLTSKSKYHKIFEAFILKLNCRKLREFLTRDQKVFLFAI